MIAHVQENFDLSTQSKAVAAYLGLAIGDAGTEGAA